MTREELLARFPTVRQAVAFVEFYEMVPTPAEMVRQGDPAEVIVDALAEALAEELADRNPPNAAIRYWSSLFGRTFPGWVIPANLNQAREASDRRPGRTAVVPVGGRGVFPFSSCALMVGSLADLLPIYSRKPTRRQRGRWWSLPVTPRVYLGYNGLAPAATPDPEFRGTSERLPGTRPPANRRVRSLLYLGKGCGECLLMT
jgi:hypothetical protein